MWLSKRSLIIGIFLGFLLSCWLGRLASRQPMFEHFQRFFLPIQPQEYFYPTASELVSYLESQNQAGRPLALVGGASYFRGTGQNPSELWTVQLQRDLGERYKVVNFAIDGAGFTSFAAVPFQIMAARHPGMIYIANGSPISGEARDGVGQYQYVFWDAYYKGMFPESVAGSDAVQSTRRAELKTAAGLELHLGEWLDSWTYACDLWTYVGYKWLFTVWCDARAGTPFKPRRDYHEVDDTQLLQRRLHDRENLAYVRQTEENNRNWARSGYTPTKDGHWRADPGAWGPRSANWRDCFPADLRSRCFIVLLRPNPYFMQSLSAEDWAHVEETYEVGKRVFERNGYNIVQFQPHQFIEDDYADAGHLLASGGNKVADATAARIAEYRQVFGESRAWEQTPGGPLEIRVRFPTTPWREEITLASIVRGSANEERVFLQPIGENKIRFGYQRGLHGIPIFSQPLVPPAGQTRTISLNLSGLYPIGERANPWKNWFSLEVGGQLAWAVPIDAADQPPGVVRVGENPNIEGSQRAPWPPHFSLPRNSTGAVIQLMADAGVLGHRLPLVTTGHYGAGDVLFASWSESGGLSFGYDHWGSSAVYSPEINLPLGSVHRIEVQLPDLAANEGALLSIKVDDQLFWHPKVPIHHPAEGEIYWGSNPIGATTAEISLSGGMIERLLTAHDR